MTDYLCNSLKLIVDGNNLTREQASLAFSEIMTGQASPAQIAAWITAMRMKGESSEELAGCIDVMRREVHEIKCADSNAVDSVGTGGDGAHTINISTTAALVAAGAGVTVAKHGNRAVSSKSGSADVLSSLGINLDISPETMEKGLNEIGFSFLFAPKLHPAMKHAIGPRRELGIRTIFNLLGPMTNPAGVKRGVIGVFSSHYCRLLAEAAAETGTERAFFVHGTDGLDEISLSGPTTVIEVCNGEITETLFNPEDYGYKICDSSAIKGGTPEENAQVVREILNGTIKDARRDIVVLNAGAAILAANKAEDWAEAFKLAEESIDSGSAMAKLDAFVELSNS